jgi:MFS family permease
MLVQPVVGVLSDRTRSRWGRRVPYLFFGAAVGIGCLYLIALAPVFALVVLGVLLIQFGANTIYAPWQALIPDQVPSSQRGLAAGIKAMFDILALVLGRLAAGQLVGRYAEWGSAAILAAVSVPVVVFGVTLLLTTWGARGGRRGGGLDKDRSVDWGAVGPHPRPLPRGTEPQGRGASRPGLVESGRAAGEGAPSAREPVRTERLRPSVGPQPPNPSAPQEPPLWQAILRSGAVDLRAHPAFGWWLANRLLFWAGFVAVSTFLVLYAVDVIGLPESAAQPFVGNLSTGLGLALVVVTLPAGWLADRIGRRPIVVGSGLLAAAGTGWMLLAGADLTQVTGAAVVVGLGVGFYLSANWALVTDLVPGDAAARYLGVANLATAGGSALARLLGGGLVDPLNHALGSASAGYLALYVLAGVFFLLSALVALRLPGRAGM